MPAADGLLTSHQETCPERQQLLDKVSLAVLAHAEATSKLVHRILDYGGIEERDYFYDEAVELREIAERAWADYREHMAWHNCGESTPDGKASRPINGLGPPD